MTDELARRRALREREAIEERGREIKARILSMSNAEQLRTAADMLDGEHAERLQDVAVGIIEGVASRLRKGRG